MVKRRWARRLVFAVFTVMLSSISLGGVAGLVPVLAAFSGSGERGTYSVTVPSEGEHCFSLGVFVPDGEDTASRPASMEGECSGIGTRLAALRLWSDTEVYPADTARLTRRVLAPALLTAFGLAVVGGWLVFLRENTRVKEQRGSEVARPPF